MKTDPIKGFLYFPIFIILIFVNAFALSMVWNWYMPSIGFPIINMVHAFGITIIMSFLTHQFTNDDIDWDKAIRWAITRPIMFLIFGYIGTFFL